MRAVAAAAGVSKATASRAFHAGRPVSSEVRARVLAAARRLGYEPDPRVSSVMSSCRTAVPVSYRETLGFIWCHQPGRWNADTRMLIERMRERARQRGFQLDEFWLHGPRMTPARLDSMLRARGIHGIVLGPPINWEQPRVQLEWSRYAAVTVGSSLWRPRLHRVHQHHYFSMVLALENTHRLGYRAPLLWLEPTIHERTNRAYLGAFHAFAPRRAAQRGSLLLAASLTVEKLRRHVRDGKADIVITQMTNVETARKAGVPHACLDGGIHNGEVAGVVFDDQSFPRAVDLAIELLARKEYGLPAQPEDLMLEGRWRDASSAPPLGKAGRPAARGEPYGV